MRLVAVDHRPCREGVVVLLAVERLLDALDALLALHVSLPVLKEDALHVLLPVVAVVGVEMALVEAKLREQHGMARQLIEVIQQPYKVIVDHEKEIEVVGLVGDAHPVGLSSAKVVSPLGKRVPHHAIARRGPVEGRRRGHPAIRPAVAVDDRDDLPLV